VLATSGRTLHVFDLYSASLRLLIRPGSDAPGDGARAPRGLGLPPSARGTAAGGAAGAGAGAPGGGGWLASLGAYEYDSASGRWAALVGAAGGLVAAHCLDTGRELWRLHSRGAAAIVALQLQAAPPWDAPGLGGAVLFGLDAASYLHAWAVPEADGASGGGSDGGGRRGGEGGGPGAPGRLQRPGVGALLGSCRLGAARLGLPTSLLLPGRGGGALFAAGWGGTLCVVGVERRPAPAPGAAGAGGPAAGGAAAAGGAGAGGQEADDQAARSGRLGAMEMGIVRTCDLSRALPFRGRAHGGGNGSGNGSGGGAGARAAGGSDGAAAPVGDAGAPGKGGGAVGSGGGGGASAPTDAAPAAGASGGGAPAAVGGASQSAVLCLEMLPGGRLLAGLADGTVLLLRFGT
jgi:hypothetical protein